MKCEDIEAILPAYILGDLDGESSQDCRKHLESCGNCRHALEFYRDIVSDITRPADIMVSVSESAALAEALDSIPVCSPAMNKTIARPLYELIGFGLASLAMLVFIAVTLGSHIADMRCISSSSWNLLFIIPVLVVVVFVTSFLPIAVTARREQLNDLSLR